MYIFFEYWYYNWPHWIVYELFELWLSLCPLFLPRKLFLSYALCVYSECHVYLYRGYLLNINAIVKKAGPCVLHLYKEKSKTRNANQEKIKLGHSWNVLCVLNMKGGKTIFYQPSGVSCVRCSLWREKENAGCCGSFTQCRPWRCN
jgi:hypothetical protein